MLGYHLLIYHMRAIILPALDYKSLLNTNHKARILRKKPLEKTFLDFKMWVKSMVIVILKTKYEYFLQACSLSGQNPSSTSDVCRDAKIVFWPMLQT